MRVPLGRHRKPYRVCHSSSMRTSAILLLSLSLVATACSANPAATAGLSGEPLSQAEDAFIASAADDFIIYDRDRGVDFLNAREYGCVFRRLVDELGFKSARGVFNTRTESETPPTASIEWGLVFLDAYYDCVDEEKFTNLMVDHLVKKWQARALERAEERITPEELACTSRLVVQEFGRASCRERV